MNLLDRNKFYDFDLPEDFDQQILSLQRPLSAIQNKFIQENELYEAFGSRRESELQCKQQKILPISLALIEASPLIRNQEQKVRRIANLTKKIQQIFNYRNVYKKQHQQTIEVPYAVQQCYQILAQAIADSNNLKYLNLSGNDLPPVIIYELSYGFRKNNTLIEIDLGSCGLTKASLGYLLRRISSHKNLRSINLFNNQNAICSKDIDKFIIEGDNFIRNIKLTHCNMNGNDIARFLRNLKKSKEINIIDVSMMQLNTQALEGLGYGLQKFKKHLFGQQKTLELLNLSYTQLTSKSLDTLIEIIGNNVSIREINFRHNRVTNIEKFLGLVKDLRKLDLSDNDLKEFNYNESLYQLILANNEINIFPEQNYLSHIISLNLESNKITQSGAFQLSALLRQVPNPNWVELILSNNPITTEGFNSIVFGLRDNYILKKLVVANCRIDGQGIICLMINHEQLSIEHLDFSANPIRQSILFVLLNFLRNGPLRLIRAQRILSDSMLNVVTNEQTTVTSFGNRSPQYQPRSPLQPPNLDYLTIGRQALKDNLSSYNQSNSLNKKNDHPIPVFLINSFNLRELDFSGNQGILQPVCASLSFYYNRIESLNLTSCNIPSHHDLRNLAYFIKKSSTILDLSLGSIGIGNIEKTVVKQFFKSLGLNQSIRRINLSDNKLGTYFHALVKHGLKSYNLEELNLRKNGIKNIHAQDLQNMLYNLKNIRDLNLEDNQLGFSSILALAKGLKEAIFLKSLNLAQQNQFTCDDLLAIAQLITQADGLQKLNLNQNQGFKNQGSEYKTLQQKNTQKQLIYQQMLFDRDNFANLLHTLKIGKKQINQLILDCCIFQREQIQFLLPILTTLKNLKHFALNHYPQIDYELRAITELKKLEILQLNYIIPGTELIKEIKQFLVNKDCKIELLDLSYNYFNDDQILYLQEGIAKNKSLKSLILRECNLSQNNLTYFGQSLNQNQSINTLDLSNNQIDESCGLFEYFFGQRVNKLINLFFSGNKDEIDFISLFIDQDKDGDSPLLKNQIKLRQVDFSRTKCSVNMFENILAGMKSEESHYGLNYIKILHLSSNQLTDDYALIISEMIQENRVIQELNLSNNYIESYGATRIFLGMLKHQSIISLNIENNKISDTFLQDIQSSTDNMELQKLQFLLIEKNLFTQQGILAIIGVMKKQERLFVNYNWKNLNDESAILILNKYIQIGKMYHLEKLCLPTFLKTINFSNCKITDNFCRYLGENLTYLFYIETIDLSLNERITMQGKSYLYINLFDPKYVDHALQNLKISDHNYIKNLFDNGVLKFFLLWLKEKLNNDVQIFMSNSFQKQLSLHDDRKNRIILQIMGGRFGSWFNKKIDLCLAYIDIRDPPDFIVSTLFQGRFQQRYQKLRIIHSVTFITFMILIAISLSFLLDLVEESNEEFWRKFDISQNNYLEIFLSRLFSEKFNLQWEIFLSLNFLSQIFEIFITKWMRSVIYVEGAPPLLIKKLKSRLPLSQEIFYSIKSFVLRLNIVIEVLVFYCLFRLKDIPIQKNDEQLENLICFIQQVYIVIALGIILRLFRICVYSIMNYYRLLKANPLDNQADYLTLTWKKFYFENFMIIASMVGYYSPNDGVQITEDIKINQIVFVETVFLIKSFPYLAILLNIQLKYGWGNGFDDTLDNFQKFQYNVFLMAIIIEIYRVIDSLHIVLTKRPNIISQKQFDKALIAKQATVNRNQFIDYKQINERDEKAKFKAVEKTIHKFNLKEDVNLVRKKLSKLINIIPLSEHEDDDDDDSYNNEDNKKDLYYEDNQIKDIIEDIQFPSIDYEQSVHKPNQKTPYTYKNKIDLL